MSNNFTTPLDSFINYKTNTHNQCGNYSIDIKKPKEDEQYRFHFDATACIGCHCCEVACNEQNNNDAAIKWRRVGETQSGSFPAISSHFNSMSCNHCIDPECLKGCPTNSYIKFDNGIVFHDDESCIGCQYCTWNCPYEVPVFDESRGIVTKCHMCHEKLDIGQTPACVQACPSGAIQIELVNTKEWLEKDMYTQGIAPHLCDVDITKPTTRYTLNEDLNKSIQTPADDHILKANHAEWPLVFMTVLTQMSLGAFSILFLLETLNYFSFITVNITTLMYILAFLPAALGLPLSALHLGRPILALTAMKNIKTSWLSREALALGLFTGALSASIVLSYLQSPYLLINNILVLALGIYGIYAQSMIYRIKARPSWNKKETTYNFFNVGYIGSLLIALSLLINEVYFLSSLVFSFSLILSIYQQLLFKKKETFYKNLEEENKNFYQLNKTKKLYEGMFKKHSQIRALTLNISITFTLIVLILLVNEYYLIAGIIAAISTVSAFVSEIIERSLFYKTAVAHGLAGHFFAGNQR